MPLRRIGKPKKRIDILSQPLPGGFPANIPSTYFKIGATNPRISQFDLRGDQHLMRLVRERFEFNIPDQGGGQAAQFATIAVPVEFFQGQIRAAQFVVTSVVGFEFQFPVGDDHEMGEQLAYAFADNLIYDPANPGKKSKIDIVCAVIFRDKNGDDPCILKVDVDTAFYGPIVPDTPRRTGAGAASSFLIAGVDAGPMNTKIAFCTGKGISRTVRLSKSNFLSKGVPVLHLPSYTAIIGKREAALSL